MSYKAYEWSCIHQTMLIVGPIRVQVGDQRQGVGPAWVNSQELQARVHFQLMFTTDIPN